MAHFAKIDENNIVLRVSVVNNEDIIDENGDEQESIGQAYLLKVHGEGTWVQSSYNNNFRNEAATVGGTYDAERDIFIGQKPHSNWILNDNFKWVPPVPEPECDPDTGVAYVWDQLNSSWNLPT